MARRRPPAVRWHVGDPCQFPWYWRGHIGGWYTGEVVAVRGDRVVVRYHRFESEWMLWELRKPPRHEGLWRRWWNHG